MRRCEPQSPAASFLSQPFGSGFDWRCGQPRSTADICAMNPESSRPYAAAAAGWAGWTKKPYCVSFRSQRGALRYTRRFSKSTLSSFLGGSGAVTGRGTDRPPTAAVTIHGMSSVEAGNCPGHDPSDRRTVQSTGSENPPFRA